MNLSSIGHSRTILVAIALSILSGVASGEETHIFATKDGAIRGADPVAYFSLEEGAGAVYGSDEFTHQWNGATWKFATAENRDLFINDPEAYAPQYGGYCAFAVSHDFTKSVNPNSWAIVDGKLYLNYNRRAQRKWLKDQSASIVRADDNWPGLNLELLSKKK